MDPLLRYRSSEAGDIPTSVAAVETYLTDHLQSPDEAGPFSAAANYLNRNGQIAPLVFNSEAWAEVGWHEVDQKSGETPLKLVRHLLAGENADGTRLTRKRRGAVKRPMELLITVPTEISRAMADLPPDEAMEVLRGLGEEAIRQLEERAVRVSKKNMEGESYVSWQQAKVLALGFLHAENKLGEEHFHLHLIIFRPAKDASGTWRTADNGEHCRFLQRGGRTQVGQVLIHELGQYGIRARITPGLARDRPGEIYGADVTTKVGSEIKRGTIVRDRRGQILALKALRLALGCKPLTDRESIKLSQLLGKPINQIQKICGSHHHRLRNKLIALGLTGPDGHVMDQKGFELARVEWYWKVQAMVEFAKSNGWGAYSPLVRSLLMSWRAGTIGNPGLFVEVESRMWSRGLLEDVVKAISTRGDPALIATHSAVERSIVESFIKQIQAQGLAKMNGDRHEWTRQGRKWAEQFSKCSGNEELGTAVGSDSDLLAEIRVSADRSPRPPKGRRHQRSWDGDDSGKAPAAGSRRSARSRKGRDLRDRCSPAVGANPGPCDQGQTDRRGVREASVRSDHPSGMGTLVQPASWATRRAFSEAGGRPDCFLPNSEARPSERGDQSLRRAEIQDGGSTTNCSGGAFHQTGQNGIPSNGARNLAGGSSALPTGGRAIPRFHTSLAISHARSPQTCLGGRIGLRLAVGTEADSPSLPTSTLGRTGRGHSHESGRFSAGEMCGVEDMGSRTDQCNGSPRTADAHGIQPGNCIQQSTHPGHVGDPGFGGGPCPAMGMVRLNEPLKRRSDAEMFQQRSEILELHHTVQRILDHGYLPSTVTTPTVASPDGDRFRIRPFGKCR